MSKSKISSKLVAPQNDGILLILSAPSGCGKTTIADRLLKRHPDWARSISVTTRPPRLGEKHGRDYFFVSRRAFQQMEAKGELLESAAVFAHSYGTPKAFVMDYIKAGKNVLLTIDIQGTRKARKAFDKKRTLLTIFVLPPSVKVLRERLEGRKTESPAEIQKRIEIAQEEIKAARLYDYTVVNQNLDQTISEIEGCFEKFQEERSKQKHGVHSA